MRGRTGRHDRIGKVQIGKIRLGLGDDDERPRLPERVGNERLAVVLRGQPAPGIETRVTCRADLLCDGGPAGGIELVGAQPVADCLLLPFRTPSG